MAVTVRCNCGTTFSVGDHLAGKRVRCARCQQPVDVPGDSAHAAAATAAPGEDYWGNLGGGKKSKKKPIAIKPAGPGISMKWLLIIGGGVLVIAGIIISVVLMSGGKSGGSNDPSVAGGSRALPGELHLDFKLEGVNPDFERALRGQYLSRLKAAGVGNDTQVKLTIEGKSQIRNRQFQPLDADDDPKGTPVDIKVPVVDAHFTFESSAGVRIVYNVMFIGYTPPETPYNETIHKAAEEASWRGFTDRIFMVPMPPAEAMTAKGPPPTPPATQIDLAKEFARPADAPTRIERYLYLLLSRTLWTELKLTKEQRIELAMMKSEFGGAGKGREIPAGEWKVPDLHNFFREMSRNIRGLLTPQQLAEFQKIYESKNLALPIITIKETKLPPGQSDKSHLLACVDYKIVSTQFGESLGWPPMAPIVMDSADVQQEALDKAFDESYALPNAEIKTPREILLLMNSGRPLVKLFAHHWIATHDAGEAASELAAELKKGFGPSWKEYFARDRDDLDDIKVFAYIAAATPADFMDLMAISEHSGGVWNRIGIAARGKLFRDCFDDVKKYAAEQVQQGKRPPIWDAAIWYNNEGRRNPKNVDPLSRTKAAELAKSLSDLQDEMKKAATQPK
jgi:hypothetical protein